MVVGVILSYYVRATVFRIRGRMGRSRSLSPPPVAGAGTYVDSREGRLHINVSRCGQLHVCNMHAAVVGSELNSWTVFLNYFVSVSLSLHSCQVRVSVPVEAVFFRVYMYIIYMYSWWPCLIHIMFTCTQPSVVCFQARCTCSWSHRSTISQLPPGT